MASGQPEIAELYVAFCDILGFSNKIKTDFEGTLEIYKNFGASLAKLPLSEVDVTIYSDAILVSAKALYPLLCAVQTLWFVALTHDLIIRGGIAKGRYWQMRQGNNLFVASDALVRAVELEKAVGVPAVFIADDIEIEEDLWLHRFSRGALQTPILHFRDRNIVSPFNPMWFASARTRATQLMEASPGHRDKYLWFLALHNAVATDAELVPPAIMASFLKKGILTKST